MPATPLSKVIAVLRAPSADWYRPVVEAGHKLAGATPHCGLASR